MFKKIIASLTLVTVLSTSVSSFAEEPTKLPPAPTLAPGESDPGEAISPLHQNQRAPFTGLLLSPEAITKLMIELQHVNDQVKIEVDHAVAKQKAQDDLTLASTRAELTYAQNTMKLQLTDKDRQIDQLTQQLKKEEDSHTNPLLLVGGGVLVGSALILATVFAAKK